MNKIALVAVASKVLVGLAFLALTLVQPTRDAATFEPSAPLDATQASVVAPPLHDQRTLQCYWRNDDPTAGVECVEVGTWDTEDDE